MLPFSTLTTMAENVKIFRHYVERHRCKTPAELPQDVGSLCAQLSEQCRLLEERNQELEAARLEVETGGLRFEKLKSKSIAKIKEVSAKHQMAIEQKDEELSELRMRLQEQELQMVHLTSKLEAVDRDATDAEERQFSDHNRLEELETLLADKNAQIVAMLEQMDGKETTANVSGTLVESSIPPALQNLPAE